jgi:hypothetical protein
VYSRLVSDVSGTKSVQLLLHMKSIESGEVYHSVDSVRARTFTQNDIAIVLDRVHRRVKPDTPIAFSKLLSV